MMFRPFRPIYVFGRRLPFTPGVIPKEKPRLAKKVAEVIGKQVITPEVLARELNSSPLLESGLREIVTAIRENMPLIDSYDEKGAEWVKTLIREHVGRLAGAFLDSEKIYSSMKQGLIDFLNSEENWEQTHEMIKEPAALALEKAAVHVAQHLDLQSLIENQINAFEPEKAEQLLMTVIRRELHLVMALGGVLGFIIGLIPVLFN